MPDVDIISTYFPEVSEIPSEKIRATRERLVNYMRRAHPTLDMRPNTPFGDHYLTPAAEELAVLEVAAGRILSDLDLDQIAKGTIWNCAFVEAFLKNFAAVPLESLPATGIMRLTFNKDQDYELNQSLLFSFIGDDVAQFSFRVPHDGPINIRQVKAPLDSRDNQFQLVELAQNSFAVDIPVSGYMNELVTAGTTGRVSEQVECLSSIVAVVDFDDGVPEDNLSKIAERSRQAFHAQTLSSRMGAISFILRQFPETQAVSPVIAGDFEMIRDTANPLGISTGGMDLYTRSKHAGHVITQQVRINYYQTQEADPQDVYVGKIDFLHTPHVIKSITWANNSEIDLGDRGSEIVVFSRSADTVVAPGLLCAFSPLEELYVTIKMPRTSGGAPYIANLIDGIGQPYAWFNITYITDPTLTTIYDHVTADVNHPIGSRVHARGFNLVYFEELTIDYRRRPGTATNLTAARNEIVSFINSCGGPEFPYSDGAVVDAMYYHANKAQVMAIRSVAKVRWTAADRFLLPDDHLPTVNYTDSLVDSSPLPDIFIHESGSFLPSWKDPNLGLSNSLHAVVGPRNVAYLLEAENLRFNEV